MPGRVPSGAQSLPPCVLHEDDDLLVVHKPAGWNTHAPAPHAGEGIYEWLRHREPRWADLAIVHRLDRETSGVMVFGKSTLANRSLTDQFTRREVAKTYTLHLSASRPPEEARVRVEAIAGGGQRVTSWLQRAGERYVSQSTGPAGEEAVTEFRPGPVPAVWLAHPLTGRTHQIRVHAAALGRPVLGDALYGGDPSDRTWLQAGRIRFRHPATAAEVEFAAPGDEPGGDQRWSVLRAILRPEETNAFRWLHGASAGIPGAHVDWLDRQVLIACEGDPPDLRNRPRPFDQPEAGVYVKQLRRDIRRTGAEAASPVLVSGEPAPTPFEVLENGVRYEVRFDEGYSYGLFPDQRDNRRRLLVNHVAAGFPLFPGTPEGRGVLNCFAYTCGFSVCAALAGAKVTSLDLSRKYLDWGRRNFVLNGLDPSAHDFLYGDCFDWLRRLGRKGRCFDAVLLDPPTFSRSKERGDFRAEADYGTLVRDALNVLSPGGVLFASCNAARWEPADFVAEVEGAIAAAGRRVTARHYVPQPPDFPVSRAEPAYLKTLWLRVE